MTAKPAVYSDPGTAGAIWRRVVANVTWRRVKALWRLMNAVFKRFFAGDGDALAGYIAYSAFLSIFPFAIFATALVGVALTPENIEEIIGALFDVLPAHLAQTLQPVIQSVAIERGQTLITTAALAGLWIASNAVEAIRVGFDRAYRAPDSRSYVWRRVRAMTFVVLASLTFTLLGVLIIAAPLALRLTEKALGFGAPIGLGLVRYAIALAVFVLFLFKLHLLLPSKRPPRRRLMPGIAVSTVLWIAGATAFSIYLSYAPNYSLTYGAFAGVIVTLLFFYLTGAVILLGAHVNAVLLSWRRPRRAESRP